MILWCIETRIPGQFQKVHVDEADDRGADVGQLGLHCKSSTLLTAFG